MTKYEVAVDVTQHLANGTAMETRHPEARHKANNPKIEKSRNNGRTGS